MKNLYVASVTPADATYLINQTLMSHKNCPTLLRKQKPRSKIALQTHYKILTELQTL